MAAGCTANQPDPLAGWNHYFNAKLDKTVVEDYQDYIQKLSPSERKVVDDYSVEPLENGTGQHAIRIEIPLNGTWWYHVLIYDKDNKRIKTIKYADGSYAS